MKLKNILLGLFATASFASCGVKEGEYKRVEGTNKIMTRVGMGGTYTFDFDKQKLYKNFVAGSRMGVISVTDSLSFPDSSIQNGYLSDKFKIAKNVQDGGYNEAIKFRYTDTVSKVVRITESFDMPAKMDTTYIMGFKDTLFYKK